MAFTRGFPSRGFPSRGYPAGWSQGTAVANDWWPAGATDIGSYLRMWADIDGSIEEIDFATEHIHAIKVQRGYGQPDRLEFIVHAPQHTTPIARRARVWLVDEAYGYWGTPVFEGHVDTIVPASTLEVQYVCYGAGKRAAHECFVMSLPWSESGGAVVEGVGSVPCLIFNVKEDTDEEYAFSRDNDATLADIITAILNDSHAQLRPLMAAPTDLSDSPYESSDLSGLTFTPQQKLVYTNETVPAAVERTLQLDPKYRMVLMPGDNRRKWRIYDVTAAAQTTFTLNDYSDDENIVLAMNLSISSDRRYSATKIYGPFKSVLAEFLDSDGTLTENWTGGQQTAFLTGGPDAAGVGNAGRVWQITDTNKRRLASKLPSDALVPVSGGFGVLLKKTRWPSLVVSYDGGNTWETVGGRAEKVVIDHLEGTVTVPNAVYRYTEGASPAFELPTHVRFIAAYYATPLSVRYPTTGFDGTFYTTDGAQVEQKIYDPALAVGWENGVPVAEATRTAQFQTLAQKLHEAYKDIVYAGGLTIAGVNYDYWDLNKRINIDAVDGNGGALTTGWESANMPLTDVEIDYSAPRQTTLTFNSDMLQFLKSDPETMKEELKIKAEQFRRDYGPAVTVSINGVRSTFYAAPDEEFNVNEEDYAPGKDGRPGTKIR